MKLKTWFIVLVIFSCISSIAQSKKELQVAAAVEQLKALMINPDSVKLSALVSEGLTYGHSSGKIEDKQTFMHTLLSGQSDFVTIDLTNQSIQVDKKSAVVRHLLSAQTNDGGKPGSVKLSVLTVWVKHKGKWQLWARQAVKQP